MCMCMQVRVRVLACARVRLHAHALCACLRALQGGKHGQAARCFGRQGRQRGTAGGQGQAGGWSGLVRVGLIIQDGTHEA